MRDSFQKRAVFWKSPTYNAVWKISLFGLEVVVDGYLPDQLLPSLGVEVQLLGGPLSFLVWLPLASLGNVM